MRGSPVARSGRRRDLCGRWLLAVGHQAQVAEGFLLRGFRLGESGLAAEPQTSPRGLSLTLG